MQKIIMPAALALASFGALAHEYVIHHGHVYGYRPMPADVAAGRVRGPLMLFSYVGHIGGKQILRQDFGAIPLEPGAYNLVVLADNSSVAHTYTYAPDGTIVREQEPIIVFNGISLGAVFEDARNGELQP
jgi:hypothetical protein